MVEIEVKDFEPNEDTQEAVQKAMVAHERFWDPANLMKVGEEMFQKALQKLLRNKEEFLGKKEEDQRTDLGRTIFPLARAQLKDLDLADKVTDVLADDPAHQPEEILDWLKDLKTVKEAMKKAQDQYEKGEQIKIDMEDFM